jgi:hypothetical protein
MSAPNQAHTQALTRLQKKLLAELEVIAEMEVTGRSFSNCKTE